MDSTDVPELSENQSAQMRHALERANEMTDTREQFVTHIVQWDGLRNEPVIFSVHGGLNVHDALPRNVARHRPDLPSKWQNYVRFSGLHPGAQILADDLGAVACILTADGEQPTHLLTAGHLFRERAAKGSPVKAARTQSELEIVVGTLVHNFLDDPPDANDTGLDGHRLDIALVKLNDAGRIMVRDSSGRGPRLSGIRSLTNLAGERARAYLTMKGQPSDTLVLSFDWETSYSIKPHALLQGMSVRKPYRLRALIACERVTRGGDSGTILYEDVADDPRAIGACVGAGNESLFTSLSLARKAARQVDGCEKLEVWS